MLNSLTAVSSGRDWTTATLYCMVFRRWRLPSCSAYSTTSPGQCAGAVVGRTLDLYSNRCTGCRSTSVSLTRSMYWHIKFVNLQHRHICQTCFIPWHLRVRRGLSTHGVYKLNGLVLNSAGALSLSQRQQCGTHYLPNKDSAVPYRLLRNIWSRYCSQALLSQRNLTVSASVSSVSFVS